MPDLYLSEPLPASTDFNFGTQSNVIVLECSACTVTVSTQSVQCVKTLQCLLYSYAYAVSFPSIYVGKVIRSILQACSFTVYTQDIQCRKIIQCILQSCSFIVSLQNVIGIYQRMFLLAGIAYNITFDLIKFCVKIPQPIILETNLFSKPAQIQMVVVPKQSTIFEIPKN